MSDIVTRLRRWTHAIDAVPASDLMDEAAAEIARLRGDANVARLRLEAAHAEIDRLRVTDEERRAATMSDENKRSAASAGCVEPVAWGLLDEGEVHAAYVFEDEAACTLKRTGDTDSVIVPLYRSPSLTDAEREAVRFFSLIDGPNNVPVANKRAATLRGLLERLK